MKMRLLMCLIGVVGLIKANQPKAAFKIEQRILNDTLLIIEFYIKRLDTVPYALGHANFGAYIDTTALDLNRIFKVDSLDGRWDNDHSPASYYDLYVLTNEDYFVLNVVRVFSGPDTVLVNPFYERVGGVAIPIKNPWGVSGCRWRTYGLQILDWNGNRLDLNGVFEPADSLFPLCAPPAAPTLTPAGIVQQCSGDSIILRASTSKVYWYVNGTLTAQDVDSLLITQSANVTVVAYNYACQTPSQDTAFVTMMPLPDATFTGPSTFCVNQTVMFVAQDTSLITYQWQSDPSVTLTQQNYFALLQSAQPGSYNLSLSVTDNNGCSNTSSQTFYVVQPPTSVTINLLQGMQDTLYSSADYVDSLVQIQWFADGQPISGASQSYLTNLVNNTTYKVCYYHLCDTVCSQDYFYQLTAVQGGVRDGGVMLLGNPWTVVSKLWVGFNEQGSLRIEVYDVAGKAVLPPMQFYHRQPRYYDLSTFASLAKGVYIIKVQWRNAQYYFRLMR